LFQNKLTQNKNKKSGQGTFLLGQVNGRFTSKGLMSSPI